MKITATVTQQEPSHPSKYPWIGERPNGRVVIFVSLDRGTILRNAVEYYEQQYMIGTPHNNFDEFLYTPIRSVTLTQE